MKEKRLVVDMFSIYNTYARLNKKRNGKNTDNVLIADEKCINNLWNFIYRNKIDEVIYAIDNEYIRKFNIEEKDLFDIFKKEFLQLDIKVSITDIRNAFCIFGDKMHYIMCNSSYDWYKPSHIVNEGQIFICDDDLGIYSSANLETFDF